MTILKIKFIVYFFKIRDLRIALIMKGEYPLMNKSFCNMGIINLLNEFDFKKNKKMIINESYI